MVARRLNTAGLWGAAVPGTYLGLFATATAAVFTDAANFIFNFSPPSPTDDSRLGTCTTRTPRAAELSRSAAAFLSCSFFRVSAAAAAALRASSLASRSICFNSSANACSTWLCFSPLAITRAVAATATTGDEAGATRAQVAAETVAEAAAGSADFGGAGSGRCGSSGAVFGGAYLICASLPFDCLLSTTRPLDSAGSPATSCSSPPSPALASGSAASALAVVFVPAHFLCASCLFVDSGSVVVVVVVVAAVLFVFSRNTSIGELCTEVIAAATAASAASEALSRAVGLLAVAAAWTGGGTRPPL
mmetsp:Transcript_25438/g.46336  ORF Transcript_25438/g.46336 Transcript_25438/m.46336 type:complete len:305 (+) Transcript_25438:363-1277(+)